MEKLLRFTGGSIFCKTDHKIRQKGDIPCSNRFQAVTMARS
jgi:hypothetical protein